MPLGLPVVPEVYSRNSGCSASKASRVSPRLRNGLVPPQVAAVGPGHVDARAPHHQNVFDTLDRPPPRRHLPQRHRLAAAELPVVMTSLASASSMRAQRRRQAANTTECMTPSRAHASATMASGTIGM